MAKSANPFTPARRTPTNLLMVVLGMPGGGKTMTALQIATTIGQRVAFIDSERGKSSLYADRFTYDILPIGDNGHDPVLYADAIRAAEANGYDVVVIDSLSAPWAAPGGALSEVDRIRKRTGNTLVAWGEVTPKHNELMAAITGARIHVVATLRAKRVVTRGKDDQGKQVEMVTWEAVQREGVDGEFDHVLVAEGGGHISVQKSRAASVLQPGQRFAPGQSPRIAADLLAWSRIGGHWLYDRAQIESLLTQVFAPFNLEKEQVKTVRMAAPSVLAAAYEQVAARFSDLAALVGPDDLDIADASQILTDWAKAGFPDPHAAPTPEAE